jgi:PIN domain nuclease of toxin-antitoxin system
MKVLIDTHTFLWFIDNHINLSITARTIIEDVSNEVFLSSASLWEMAIKISTGKLSLSQPFQTFISNQLSINDIGTLEIQLPHIALLASLPFHHRDPFDRMLIVQAIHEQIPIVGNDVAFDAYGVTRLW